LTLKNFDFFSSSDLFTANVNYAVYLPPDARMIYDYMIDLNTFIYHEWESLVPKTEQLIKNENSSVVIPTVDIVRYSFLITAVLIHKKPVLLTGKFSLMASIFFCKFILKGNSGVGKTLLIEAMLRSLTSPDGNFIRPGTILGDVLQYNATRSSAISKLAQAGDTITENTEGGSKYNRNIFLCFFS
jgi:hypothetical protein